MNNPIAILAGNWQQFIHYQRFHPEENIVYCGSERDLLGMEISGIVIFGTFWERKDSITINELAKTRIR